MIYWLLIGIIVILEFAFGYLFDTNGWFVVGAVGLTIFSPLIISLLKEIK